MFDKVVDLSAEKAVLAGIFTHGLDAYIDVSDIITQKTFTDETNQVVYKCFEHIFKEQNSETIDIASLLSTAKTLKLEKVFEGDMERKHLRAISIFPINKDNIRKLAAKIRKLEIARLLNNQVLQASESLLNVTGEESIDSIIAMAEGPIFDFSSLLGISNGEAPAKIGDGIESYVEYLMSNPVQQVGIPSGYPDYDRAIGGGFRPNTINLVGARAKVGKTLFADNVAMYVAGQQKIPVLNLDTEMSKEDHWNRMIANLAGVSINELETGQFAKDKHKRDSVIKAKDYLKSIPYDYKSIAGMPFEEIIAIMRRWVKKEVGFNEAGKAKPCLIIYDYLKLMSSDSISNNLQEYQVLGFQMTGLHNFMVKYGTACLAFIQLNRDGIDKEDTASASGSDRLIWLCSNFTIYKPKSDEEIAEDLEADCEEKYTRKLVPIIARHGAGLEPGDYINMKMEGQFGRITQGKTRNEIYGCGSKKKPTVKTKEKKEKSNDSTEDISF